MFTGKRELEKGLLARLCMEAARRGVDVGIGGLDGRPVVAARTKGFRSAVGRMSP